LEIVNGDEREIIAKLRAIATALGLEERIAYNGMKLILR
jgi:hypothetical protein